MFLALQIIIGWFLYYFILPVGQEIREYGRRDPSRGPRGHPLFAKVRRQAAVTRSVEFARGLRPWSFFSYLLLRPLEQRSSMKRFI
jgi:hypothetical protein